MSTVGRDVGVRAYALVSGGKDSVTLAHILASKDMLAGVVAIDTGISIPEWRPFIEDLCREQGWPLTVIATSYRYEDLVRRYGFPGPGAHGIYMTYLKGRAIREFAKEGRGRLLASGVRIGESKRRFNSVREWNVIEGLPIWAPIWDWTTEEVWDYVRMHGLPRSPGYATLGISGDCLCGAFARPDERDILEQVYPDVFARLVALERETGLRWGCGSKARGVKSRAERVVCVECDPSGTPESGTR